MESTIDGLDRGQRIARTRRKKRKAVIGIFPRFVLIAAAALVMALVCYKAAVRIIEPYKMQQQQAAQIRALKAQIASNDADNAALQTQIHNLNMPVGIETAARAQGYLKPGEVSLQVKVNPTVSKTAESNSGFTTMIHRAWSHLMNR